MQGMCCSNLLKGKASCPMCNENVKPATCGFVGCAWMYDGRKLAPDGDTYSSSSWQVCCSALCVAEHRSLTR